jgi:hypothetical protein
LQDGLNPMLKQVYTLVTLLHCCLQTLATAWIADAPQAEQYGQLRLHLPAIQQDSLQADGLQAESSCVQLLWCNLQHGLQLCLLSRDLPLQLFMHNTQQQLVHCKLDAAAIAPLLLLEPALAAVVVDAGGHWVTYNTTAK